MPATRTVTRSRAFSPLQLAGLVAWYDADDILAGTGAQPAANAPVPLWKDKSGNGHDLAQANPVYAPNFLFSTPAVKTYGDSLTVGIHASVVGTTNWVPLLGQAENWLMNNLGHSGDQALETFFLACPQIVQTRDVSTLMIGVNDQWKYLTDANKLAVYQGAHMASVVWLALPDTAKVYPGTMTQAGTWTGAAGIPSGLTAIATIVPGSTATFTTSGPVAYVCGYVQNGVTSTYSVTIDGVSQGTFSCTPPGGVSITTNNGLVYGANLLRFTGLGAGSHTVVVTAVTCATSNPVYLLFGASVPAGTKPSVIVGNVIRQTATYPSGGSDANVSAYNAAIATNIANAVADGLNVYAADPHSTVNNTTDLWTDGVHPVDAGHGHIRDAFVTAATAAGITLPTKAGVVGFGGAHSLASAAFALAQPTTVFIVASKLLNSGSGAYMYDGGSSSTMLGGGNYNATPQGSPTQVQIYAGSNLLLTVASGLYEALHVLTAKYKGASSLNRVDGGSGGTTTGNAGSATASGLTVGAAGGGGAGMNGYVREMIVCSADSSASDMAKAEAYLKARHGTP